MYLIPNLGILENLDPRGQLREGIMEGGGWEGREGKVPWGPSPEDPDCIPPRLTLRMLERLAKKHLDKKRL